MQIPLDKKQAMADDVVVNNHPGLDSLTSELVRILDRITGSLNPPSP
jgi:dephospho-CoA kinase